MVMTAPRKIGNREEAFASATIGPTAKALIELSRQKLDLPNLPKLYDYTLGRVTAELQKRELGGILLFDPINIRYATGARNMQVWTSRNLSRAAFISAQGYVVHWDFTRCAHLSPHLDNVNELRSGAAALYFSYGDKENEQAQNFVQEIKDLIQAHGCDNRIAIDTTDIATSQALQNAQIKVLSGQGVMEHARLIKGPEEIKAMRCAVSACQSAVAQMEAAMRPGMAEVELWSVLHQDNIARGGEWIETRLCASGPRTNPWMQEAGSRQIEEGDLFAFDTDMIGLYGYCCDMSRTWLVGTQASAEQKEVFKVAHDHVTQNMELMQPGTAFRELSFGGHQLPEAYRAQRYCVKMHGTGMCDEFPSIYYPEDYIEGAFDYHLEPGMVFSVEVYAGKVGGRDGVKLENQVLITDSGYENLTDYPYDARLLE